MNRTLGGILLVSGTTIGAGILALPVVNGFAGFFASSLYLIIFWLFMTYTALLMLEVNLWVPKEHGNMLTMAQMTLGSWGKAISWVAYLFLLYALTTAYIAGGGPILNAFIGGLLNIEIPKYLEAFPLLLIFGYFVYRGTHSVDFINRLLMIGLVITFFLMVGFLIPNINISLLSEGSVRYVLLGSSVIATSFGFHIIIPSLTTYLHRDVRKLKQVILIGSAIPLFVYIIWQTLVLGIVPLEGPISLSQGYAKGMDGATLLGEYLGQSVLGELPRAFSLFSIVTSFLGVSMSLSDFLADGLKIKRDIKGNVLIFLATFLPPLLIVLTDPRAFLSALEYAGAFGVVFLLGLMPALMALRGRKLFGKAADYRAPGGTLFIGLAILFSIVVIGIEILHKVGTS